MINILSSEALKKIQDNTQDTAAREYRLYLEKLFAKAELLQMGINQAEKCHPHTAQIYQLLIIHG
jgi:hypothetical protein